MNEKINVFLHSFFKGSGFKKIQDESKKTYDELQQIGKIKSLNEDVGKSYGVLGGIIGKTFSKIFSGGIYGFAAKALDWVINKWKDYRQKVEEAKKAQEEALGKQMQKRAKESAEAIDELVESYKKIQEALNAIRKHQDELLKAQEDYTKAVRENEDAILDRNEAEELSKLNPYDKEGQARIKNKYDTIRSERKSKRGVEDAQKELDKTTFERDRLQADIERKIKEREELNDKRIKTIISGKKIESELGLNPFMSKSVKTALQGQVDRYSKDEKKLEGEIKAIDDEILLLEKKLEIEKQKVKTAEKRVDTAQIQSKASNISNQTKVKTTEDDIVRTQALSQLQDAQRQAQQNAKYASDYATKFDPSTMAFQTRQGAFNFGAFNSATKIDQQLDNRANEASNLAGTIQRFVDSKQAEKMSIEELLKVIEQFVNQNKQLSREINNTVERAKRIQ